MTELITESIINNFGNKVLVEVDEHDNFCDAVSCKSQDNITTLESGGRFTIPKWNTKWFIADNIVWGFEISFDYDIEDPNYNPEVDLKQIIEHLEIISEC